MQWHSDAMVQWHRTFNRETPDPSHSAAQMYTWLYIPGDICTFIAARLNVSQGN